MIFFKNNNSNDDLHENALRLEESENILSQDCYINNNVLNEVLTLTGRKINIDAAEEIYYSLIDSFEILNEYNIFNYTAKTFDIFKMFFNSFVSEFEYFFGQTIKEITVV